MKICLLCPCSQDTGPDRACPLTVHSPLRDFLDPQDKKWAVPLRHSDEQVVFGRHFREERVFLIWGGRSPSVLASFLGLTQSLPRAARLGGVGLQQVRYSEDLFKAAGSSPLLFTALPLCRVGAAIVTHPPAPQEHSSPVHPHRDGGVVFVHLHSLPGGPAACRTGPMRHKWTLASPSLAPSPCSHPQPRKVA